MVLSHADFPAVVPVQQPPLLTGPCLHYSMPWWSDLGYCCLYKAMLEPQDRPFKQEGRVEAIVAVGHGDEPCLDGDGAFKAHGGDRGPHRQLGSG